MSVTAIPVIFLITLVVLTQSGKDISSHSSTAAEKKAYLAPLNYNYSTVSKQEEAAADSAETESTENEVVSESSDDSNK